jgi:hypothetical protein
MSPANVGAILGELIAVVVDAAGRVDAELIAAELAELSARVRRLAPLSSAIAEAAARRRAQLADPEDGS